MTTVIKITSVKKLFHEIVALNNLNLSINEGEMFGLVGPDGAGKTTTIRLISGIYAPTEGKIEILGYDGLKERNKVKNSIGYLSQKFSLYGDLTIDENIEFFSEIHNVRNFKERREELLEFTRLKEFRNRFAENLSGGMKQKLALACTLVHSPKLLLLDEPTTGVDPVSRRDFWKILADLLKIHITILISTPYLDEAERCHRVALIDKGSILKVDTPNNLKKLLDYDIFEIVTSDVRKSFNVLSNNDQFIDVQAFGDRINIILEKSEDQLISIEKLLETEGIEILSSRKISPSLENVFINLLKKNR